MNTQQTTIDSVQKHILELNHHLNCKADRAFEARQALGAKGTEMLNDLFKASCDFNFNNNVEALTHSLSMFTNFLCDNIAKATSLRNCMAASRNRTLIRLTKLSKEMASFS